MKNNQNGRRKTDEEIPEFRKGTYPGPDFPISSPSGILSGRRIVSIRAKE
jgi:hypothetical protein